MWPFSRKEKRASPEDPRYSLGDPRVLSVLFGGGETESGETVTPQTALKVPALWSGVNFLSGTIASLPLHTYRRTSEGREIARGDSIYPKLHDAPNAEWTSYGWRKYTMQQVLTRGRGLTFIERNQAGQVMNLWPLNPAKVTVKRVDGVKQYEYREDENGKPVIYRADEIIDIPFMMDEDQLSAISPVDRLKDVIGLSLSLQTYAARHFRNGGVPPAVLQGPAMSPGAANRASEDIKAAISNAIKEGRIPAIPEGYELKPLGVDPEKSQMEASRRFAIEEFARMLNMPPVFLQDLTHGTFSNTEQQDLHFVKHTLTQWLKAIEQELNLKLFPRTRTRFVEFSVDGLLRGDFATRMSGYATAIQNSIKTPNEVRQKENDPPMDGGDRLVLQTNMVPLGQLDLIDQSGEPAGEPNGNS